MLTPVTPITPFHNHTLPFPNTTPNKFTNRIETMNHRQPFATIVAVTLALMLPNVVRAQDIKQIAESDPLIITGAVGTQNTYYHSSLGSGHASPLSNSVFANLNISVYGFSMPFSFYYTNDNLDFNYPQLSFNLQPHYKNWTGHFGQSSLGFSNYVMSMSFNGVGIEYNDNKHWRFGAFYGVLRKAINDDPLDPAARTPQYKRMGWGFKVGYGSGANFLDLYFLRAYDRLKSLDERWHQTVSPQENIVVGLKANVQPLKVLSLSLNAASSVLSTDSRSEKVQADQAKRWDKVFDVRYSTLARFAGDANLTLSLPSVTATASYRIIQPDYTSLGNYYISNNMHSLGLTLGTYLFKKVSLSASFSGQEDNLSKRQMFTTRGLVYNVNLSTRIGKYFNIAAGYNGYTQKQNDGTAHVNDSTRVNRQMQGFTLTPSVNVDGNLLSHSVSLATSYTNNADKNPFALGQSDVKALALGLSYTLGVKPWEIDFTATANHSVSKGYRTKYTSDILTLGTSRSFLKEKELTVSLSGSLCYNSVQYQSKSLSLAGDVQVGYTLKQVHSFALNASFSKYGDVNQVQRVSGLDATDITASLNYTYTFSLLEIKRKADKKQTTN